MCEIDRAAIPQMCWSNLQPELVQQASPLKGLMQCQNLWLRGHPLSCLPNLTKAEFLSLTIRFSFFFYWIHQRGRHEMWDVNETFSLEGRRILGQRQGRSWSEPMTSPTILSFSFFLFFCPSYFPQLSLSAVCGKLIEISTVSGPSYLRKT